LEFEAKAFGSSKYLILGAKTLYNKFFKRVISFFKKDNRRINLLAVKENYCAIACV